MANPESGVNLSDGEDPLSIVGIVAPSDRLQGKDKRWLKQSLKLVRSWGWDGLVDDGLQDRRDRYKAGSAEERLNEIGKWLDIEAIGVLGVFKGGYGLPDILKGLEKRIPEWSHYPGLEKKWVIGYSDGIGLLYALKKLGLKAAMGPNFGWLSHWDKKTRKMYRELVEEDKMPHITQDAAWRTPKDKRADDKGGEYGGIIPGEAEGSLIPCSLDIFLPMTDTWYSPLDGKNKYILAIEDTGIQKTELERHLHELENMSWWSKVSGVVVGRIPDIQKDDYHKADKIPVAQIVRHWADGLDNKIPIAFCQDFGHIGDKEAKKMKKKGVQPRFYPLVVGAPVRLKVGQNQEEGCELRYLQRAQVG